MPVKILSVISSMGTLQLVSVRRVAVGLVVLATLGFLTSVILTLVAAGDAPVAGASGTEVASLQLLPLLVAFLGTLAGVLCLTVAPAPSPLADGSDPGDPFAASGSELLGVVDDLRQVLADERSKVHAFQEICSANMREVRVLSTNVARLSDVALDAEARLAAGVAQAGEALRQPVPGDTLTAEATQRVERALPEIADLIMRGVAEQTKAVRTALDTVFGQLAAEADGAVQTFRETATVAAGHMTVLADTAVALRRDVIALDTAGRAIATAGATVVSRVGGAVAHLDAAVASLPAAAAAVSAAAEKTGLMMTEASAVLCADSAAMDASVRDSRQAAELVHREVEAMATAQRGLAETGHDAIAQVAQSVETAAARLGTMIAGGDHVRHDPASLGQLTTTLEKAAASLVEGAASMSEASAAMCADSAAMDASVRESRQAAEMVQREATALATAKQQLSDAGQQAIASVVMTIETTAARLAAMITDADDTRQSAASRSTADLTELTATLGQVAVTLADGASSLDAAGQRFAAAGDTVADRYATDTARGVSMLAAFPDVAAELAAAAENLRLETFVLTAAAQEMAAAGTAATCAITDVTVRAEISAASLDTAGRVMSVSGAGVASQIDRLAEVARQAEAQTSLLPDAAAHMATAAARLKSLTESWPNEKMLTMLPEAAARFEAAGIELDRLDELSRRLERAIAAMPAEPAQQAALLALTARSADIDEAVRRVEAALASQERAWPAVAASMAQVGSAATVVATATAEQSAALADREPTLANDGPPAALAATLRRLDNVSSQTEVLQRQTEELVEAVIKGAAPGLPSLLADNTPVLLAGIETTSKRMRSIATALAMLNDGVPAADLAHLQRILAHIPKRNRVAGGPG